MVAFIIIATIVEWFSLQCTYTQGDWSFGYAKEMVNLNGIEIGCLVAQLMFVSAFLYNKE